MSISEFLTMEAARMAQALGYHRPVMNSKEDETTCYRVFWVVYILEKCATFMTGKSSVSHLFLLLFLKIGRHLQMLTHEGS